MPVSDGALMFVFEILACCIAGGCGSMYNIFVESEKFRGIRLPKQHQLVAAAIEVKPKTQHTRRNPLYMYILNPAGTVV
jgi:hypothetical protein